MPRGDKSKYTDKQKRQAEHIEEGYKERGVSEAEAERRAWATVNDMPRDEEWIGPRQSRPTLRRHEKGEVREERLRRRILLPNGPPQPGRPRGLARAEPRDARARPE